MPLTAGLAGLSVLAALFLLYDVAGYRVIRHTLFVTPLLLVTVVEAAYPSRLIAFIGRKHYSAYGFAAAMAVAIVLCFGSWSVSKTLGADVVARDAETRAHTEILESLEHDDRPQRLGNRPAAVAIVLCFGSWSFRSFSVEEFHTVGHSRAKCINPSTREL